MTSSQAAITTRETHLASALLRISDAIVVGGTAYLSFSTYLDTEPVISEVYVSVTLFSVLLTSLIFSNLSLYEDWGRASRSAEIKKVTGGWLAVFVTLVVGLSILKYSYDVSRAWLGIWFITGWCWLIAARFAVRKIEASLHQRGIGQRSVIIVGTEDLCNRAAHNLQHQYSLGYRVAGKIPLQGASENEIAGMSLPDIAEYVRKHNPDEVWIALPLKFESILRSLIHQLRNTTVDIRYLPDVYGMRLLNHSVASVAGLPVVNLSITPMAGINGVVKTIQDLMISSLILIMISPLLALIAIAVKATSKGPVLYKQTRVSLNGKEFTMLKFRSMPVDAEASSGPKWASAGEDRATPVGGFLRKTSLDELPQFFNVLKGEMSIVGPRPERPEFVEEFKDNIQDYMKKHLVKAGITGWAQVNGLRGDTDLRKRIEYDLFYIENWSLWFDLEIIFLTLFKGFVNKNAY